MCSADRRDGLVLVVGSGGRHYREYLLRGAAQRHPVWLLDAVEPTWQRQYIAGASVVPLVDAARLIPDEPGLIGAALDLAGRRRVAGILSYDETLVNPTARIAETLELPGLTVEGADRCRNKHRSRQVLTAARLPQPLFTLAASLDDAVAAGAVGYPRVLKPRGMGASIGVVRADSQADLAAAFAVAERASHGGSPSYEGGVIVEELLEGPEISVDGAILDGEYRPLFLARKRVSLAPYFEEVGHTVDASDPLLADPELLRILTEAHAALGLGFGTTHTEVLLTARGPVIVEVNARLGGDLIPYLGKLATGIDPAHVAVDLALGRRPAIDCVRNRCVGVRFLYPPEDCRVRSVSLPASGSTPGLVEARAMVAPGAELLLPPRAHLGRYAHLVCEGPDADACTERLDAAADIAVLEGDPLAVAAPTLC